MLNAHSEVHFNKETHFIKNYVHKEIVNGKYSGNQILRLEQELKSDESFSDFSDKISEVIRESINLNEKFTTPFIFKKILGKEGKRYFGEKDPMNVNYLSTIDKAFPESKVIHITRDPRDVILSRIKSGWGNKNSLIWHTSEYKFSFCKARREGKEIFKSNYLEVRYEDLISNIEKELTVICDFLGIRFEPQMCHPEKFAGELVRPDEMQWKSNVLNPVNKENVGKWKSGFTAKQLFIVETILNEILLQMSYTRISAKNFVRSFYYNVISSCIQFLFKLKFSK